MRALLTISDIFTLSREHLPHPLPALHTTPFSQRAFESMPLHTVEGGVLESGECFGVISSAFEAFLSIFYAFLSVFEAIWWAQSL